MRRTNLLLTFHFSLFTCCLLQVQTAPAATGTWTSTGGGNWTDTTKWSGGIIADGVDFTSNFTSDITAATTVNLNGVNRTIGNLNFSDNGTATNSWVITGNTLTLDVTSGSPAITTTNNATISSILAGNDGFTKSGSATMTLNNSSNSYTGTTTINGGTLQVESFTMSGALAGAGTLRNDSGTSAFMNISGDISGFTGTLSYNNTAGGNNLHFPGGSTSNYDGSQAKFALSGSTTVARALSFGASGTFKMGELSGTGGGIATRNAAVVTLEVGALNTSTTYSGVLVNTQGGTGTLGLTKVGNGTLKLDGANTYTGTTTINGGTLQVESFTMSGALAGSGTLLNSSNTSAFMNISGDISGFTGTISYNNTVGGNNLHFPGGSSSNYDGSQAKFALIGSTTIARALSFGANGTFKMGELSGTGGGIATRNAAVVTLEVGALNTSTTYSGVLVNTQGGTGTLGLTKVGSGTLTLSGANTYTGGTNFNDGVLSLNSSGAIGSSGTISFDGGTLRYTSSNTTDYSSRFSTAASQQYKVDTNGQNATWATALTSSGGTLTKSGSGTLSLTNSSNSYTGTTTINGGTLEVESFTMSGALAGSGTLRNDSSTSAFMTISGDISGFTGTISYNNTTGGNNLLFSGGTSSNYDGSQAKFALSGSTTIARALSFGASGTFKMGELSGTGGGIATRNAAIVTLEVGALGTSTTFSGALVNTQGGTGTLSFTKVGSGTLTLSGANTYTGTTTINGGTLELLRPGTINSSAITVNSGGTLQLNPNGTIWNPGPTINTTLDGGTLAMTATSALNQYIVAGGAITNVSTASSAIDVNVGAASGSPSTSLFLDGGLKGSGTVTINGGSIAGVGVVLRNNNTTFSGTLIVNGIASTALAAGSGLGVGNFTTQPSLSNANITVNGTMELGGGTGGGTGLGWGNGTTSGLTLQIGALGGTGVVVANNLSGTSTRGLSVGNNDASGNFSGVIANGASNTLSLTKAGTGTQILSGTSANTYLGSTFVTNGELHLGKSPGTNAVASDNLYISSTAGGLPSGTASTVKLLDHNQISNSTDVTLYSLGLLNLNGFDETINQLLDNGSGGSVDGTSGSPTFTVASGSFAGVITDTAGTLTLVKNTSGNLLLKGVNTYAGATDIQGGILAIGSGNDRLPTTTTVTLGSGGSSGKLRLSELAGTPAAHNQTLAGLLTSGSGTSNRVVGGAATDSVLTLNIAGSNTYDGFLGGTGTDENNLALTKTGVGTLTLTGANTYNGATNVNQGTLLVNGTHTGGGLYTVANGATLGGSGSITAAVNFASGSIGSPGNSPGLFTSGNQTWNNLDTYVWEVAQPGTAGVHYDSYDVNGLLNFNAVPAGGITLELTQWFPGAITSTTDTFVLWTYDSLSGWDQLAGIPSNMFTLTNPGGYFDFSGAQIYSTTGNGGLPGAIILTGIFSVPEPSTYALGLAGLAGLGLLAWRRKSAAGR
jgi:autotransporter-associated beta strand protein